MLDQLTLGKFKELTKDMPDDAVINFIYRENLLDDEGSDYLFTPSSLWISDEEAEEKEITLVSVLPPQEMTDSEDIEDFDEMVNTDDETIQ